MQSGVEAETVFLKSSLKRSVKCLLGLQAANFRELSPEHTKAVFSSAHVAPEHTCAVFSSSGADMNSVSERSSDS